MATLNADKLASDIVARTRRSLEETALRLLYGNGPARSEYTAHSRFYDLPVYTNPLMPAYKARIVLSRKLDVSEKFRADTNKWLRDFFGEEPYVIIARLPGLGVLDYQEAIFCNPGIEGEIRRRRALLGTVV